MLTKTRLAELQGLVHLNHCSRLCYEQIKHFSLEVRRRAPPIQYTQTQTEEKKQLNADFPQQTDTIF